jgi:glycosyltransferase involved in cell wall biosynthesis
MSTANTVKPIIIHVTSYYPPHLGGMEKGTALRAEKFAERGYKVLVYTSDRGYTREAANNNIPVYYLKSIEFAHTPIIFSLFFRLLALPRHSLIHLHVAQAFSPEIVYLVAKLRNIPYIAHIHLDVDPSGPFGFLLKPYKQFFLKRVLQAAASILCQTEHQQETIAARYRLPQEAMVVIPNGVAEEYFVEKRANENPVPHLLFVGRLGVQKNLPLLIEAVARMQTSIILDIVGEGDLRKKIEALIQQYQLQNVKLHGLKTGKDLIEFYRSADIFVLPSFKEGLSNAMLEALAAGLPIVASDLPELRPILGDCGVLIKNPDAANYAKALDALLADKNAMSQLSYLSKQKARAYSWQAVLDATEKLYQETATRQK